MASSQPKQPVQTGQTSQTAPQSNGRPAQMAAQIPATQQKPVFTDFASI